MEPTSDLFAPWVRVRTAAGVELHLRGEGRRRGVVRVAHRVRPLSDFGTIIAGAVRHAGAGPPRERRDAVTIEGESAAMASAPCPLDGVDGELRVWAVFGDDFYAQITGAFQDDATHGDRFRSFIDTLAIHLPLRLGRLRARRIAHEAPAGWTRTGFGLETRYDAPDGPLAGTRIWMLAARPFAMESVVASWVYEDAYVIDAGSDPISSAPLAIDGGALRGHLIHAAARRVGESPPLDTFHALLEDRSFRYVARCETPATDLALAPEIFLDVVRSMQTIPAPPQRRTGDGASYLLSNYIE